MKARPLELLAAMVLALTMWSAVSQKPSSGSAAPKEGILNASDVGGKIFPDKVFFRGQSAPVQARNSAGVRYSDDFLVLAALVDSSGYSSGIREKYQGYLMTEVPIEIGGQTLKPGAYGFGFIDNNKFVVMDLGANDIAQVTSTKDADLKRPVPLQIIAGSTASNYRLYKGRDYVEFHRTK